MCYIVECTGEAFFFHTMYLTGSYVALILKAPVTDNVTASVDDITQTDKQKCCVFFWFFFSFLFCYFCTNHPKRAAEMLL